MDTNMEDEIKELALNLACEALDETLDDEAEISRIASMVLPHCRAVVIASRIPNQVESGSQMQRAFSSGSRALAGDIHAQAVLALLFEQVVSPQITTHPY